MLPVIMARVRGDNRECAMTSGEVVRGQNLVPLVAENALQIAEYSPADNKCCSAVGRGGGAIAIRLYNTTVGGN